MSARSGSFITFKCLYNVISLSCSPFCYNGKVDGLSLKVGVANVRY